MGQCPTATVTVTEADIVSAVALAKAADVAIVNVATTSGEGYDRPTLGFGDMQDKLVREVAAVNSNTIVVMRIPGAVEMPWAAHPNVTAILAQFLPGQESGHALASLLFGDVSPSGIV
jgi:beta-glucosidase